jgi:hypothetical protein
MLLTYTLFAFIGYFVMLLTNNDIGVSIVSIKRFDSINTIVVFGGISLQHAALQYVQHSAPVVSLDRSVS